MLCTFSFSIYHPLPSKVSSVDLQSIIRWPSKYYPLQGKVSSVGKRSLWGLSGDLVTGVELVIFTALADELFVRATLDDTPVVHHDDHVRVSDRA